MASSTNAAALAQRQPQLTQDGPSNLSITGAASTPTQRR